jgi:hypothetical protein
MSIENKQKCNWSQKDVAKYVGSQRWDCERPAECFYCGKALPPYGEPLVAWWGGHAGEVCIALHPDCVEPWMVRLLRDVYEIRYGIRFSCRSSREVNQTL